MRAAARVLATALGLALVGAAPDPLVAARYFVGSWKCGGAPFAILPLSDGSPWIRITYGGQGTAGSALFGYAAGLGGWIYRDFHENGDYAELSSPGPADGRWQWTGPYYPQEGGTPLQGRMTYVEVSPTRFDRTFELLRDQEFLPAGNDTCLKVST